MRVYIQSIPLQQNVLVEHVCPMQKWRCPRKRKVKLCSLLFNGFDRFTDLLLDPFITLFLISNFQVIQGRSITYRTQ